uniref:GB1/RHD3-type G domain-containing protein n=1 Tax=Sphenodon punctatus TaxID=8508 RepID=A0A8D0HC30_SPHPU
MASTTRMAEPVCLVEPSSNSATLRVNPAALCLLQNLACPLHVVAIFGPRGTGKSFLLDQLAGQVEGFPRSPGIWMQCLPHPTRPGHSLVLLDTEGFPEVEETKFSRFFLLNVLLSSVFVYNTKDNSDFQSQLNCLTYVTELPHKVRVVKDCPEENDFLLNGILPDFVWCLRDMAPGSVLEEVLQNADSGMDCILDSLTDFEDSPAGCVQRLFRTQKPFCFCSPWMDGEGGDEPGPPDELHPIFQVQLELFKDYALSRQPKTLAGNNVDGKSLASFLEWIVDALSLDELILLDEICDSLQGAHTKEGRESSMDQEPDLYMAPSERREVAVVSQAPVWEPKRETAVRLQNTPPSRLRPPQATPGMDQPGFMEKPMCLIENRLGQELQVNQEALSILCSIQQPVVVVAIVGLYRTGKSYLMNKLVGKDQGGFSLGATVQANTKGIWMWCVPHPLKRRHTLVLLDTEGLGDVEKSNEKNDSWVFALSVLLSSTFVYNSMGTIDHFALEKLHYVTELTERIKVKASPGGSGEEKEEDSAEFIRFFPGFVWAVRDFALQLVLDGRPISEDEYLENALRRREGVPEKLDLPKKYLRQYFPSRKCFTFDRPASRNDLPWLEELPESKLSRDFVEQTHRFCSYIYEHSQAKAIQGGHVMTGALLGNLAVTYVDAIRSGAVPCMENAVLVLAQIENSAAVHEAITRYKEMMELLLGLPTDTLEELLAAHSESEKEAIQVFMARAFRDEDQEYQTQLASELQSKFQEFCQRNEHASLDRCQAVLMELFQEMEDRVSQGSYSVPGGYQRFLDDQRNVLKKYETVASKGLMAAQALEDFLRSKEEVAQTILRTDESLSDKQKELEEERARAEAAERETKLSWEMQKKSEQMLQDQKRSHDIHVQQLEVKMDEDRRKLMAEQERVLTQKLQEQERLLREGFQGEATRLQGQIQNLTHEMNQSRSRGKRGGCVIC